MNKKILGMVVALMAVALLATPVMAISPNKIEIEFDGTITYGSPPTLVWLHGDVQHGRNGSIIYEDCSITGDGINLVDGYMTQIADYDINVKGVPTPPPPPPPIFRFGKGVMHYRLNLTFADGSFIGSNTLHGLFRVTPFDTASLWNGTSHALLHGTDAYAGWTWVFTAEAVKGVPVFEAYMIIPKPKLP